MCNISWGFVYYFDLCSFSADLEFLIFVNCDFDKRSVKSMSRKLNILYIITLTRMQGAIL